MNLKSVIDELNDISDELVDMHYSTEASKLDAIIMKLIDIKTNASLSGLTNGQKLDIFHEKFFKNMPKSVAEAVNYYGQELANGKRQAMDENNITMSWWIDGIIRDFSDAADDDTFAMLQSNPQYSGWSKLNFLAAADIYKNRIGHH